MGENKCKNSSQKTLNLPKKTSTLSSAAFSTDPSKDTSCPKLNQKRTTNQSLSSPDPTLKKPSTPRTNPFSLNSMPHGAATANLSPQSGTNSVKLPDRDDIVIAKSDATANEFDGVEVSGFPTLKYFPKGERKIVDYSGGRDLESLKKFVETNGGEDAAEEEEDDTEEEVEEAEEPAEEAPAKDEL